jgi:hypothetical protein
VRRLLLPLLLLLTLPAPVVAAAEKGLYGDGIRFAAWDEGDVVQVFDDRGPRTQVPIPPGCDLTGLTGGRLVFTCSMPTGSTQALTVALPNGAPRALIPWIVDRSDWYVRFTGVGTQWAATSVSAYHVAFHTYERVSDGTVVPVYERPRGSIPDLDRPSLWVTVCAPVRIPRDVGDFIGIETNAVQTDDAVVYDDADANVLRWPCGASRPRRIGVGPWAASHRVVAVATPPGIAVWLAGRRHVLRSSVAPGVLALTGTHVLGRDGRGFVVIRRLPSGA